MNFVYLLAFAKRENQLNGGMCFASFRCRSAHATVGDGGNGAKRAGETTPAARKRLKDVAARSC